MPNPDSRPSDTSFAIGLLVLSLGCAAEPPPPEQTGTEQADAAPPAAVEVVKTTVLLVRHAEKQSEASNANLTAAGHERAQALATLAAERGVTAIYATEFCRTVQTAQPAAARLDLGLSVQPNSSPEDELEGCDPAVETDVIRLDIPIDDYPGLAERIRTQHAGETVLVVGHSNTVPALAAAFTGTPICPEPIPFDPKGRCFLPDADFHHLISLEIGAPDTAAELSLEAYGTRN